MKRLHLLISIVIVTSAVAQTRPVPPAAPQGGEQIIAVGTRAVHIREEGKGSPTVVFETGLGDTLETWTRVFPEVVKFAHAFAYDRAGSGKSSPGAGERSYTELATELHQALETQKIPPPYLLVGHSFGAVISRAFAAAYPGEVSGIVFIDPLTDVAIASTKAEAPKDDRMDKATIGVQGEFSFLKRDTANHFAIMNAIPKPNVPMTLLIARSVRPQGWVKAVLDRYGPWIIDREDSSMTVTSNSSQFIQGEEPELVVNSIRRMLFPNLQIVLRRTLRDKGADAAVAAFRSIAPNYPRAEVTADVLNTLGYGELHAGHIDNALRIFMENAVLYPADANVYDSLGEAYALKGDRDKAIENYKRSIELDPQNLGAAQAIIKLQSGAQP